MPDASEVSVCDDAAALASQYVVHADPELREQSQAHQEAIARFGVLAGVRGYTAEDLRPIEAWAREHGDPYMEGQALTYGVIAGALGREEQLEQVERAYAAYARAGARPEMAKTAAIAGVLTVDEGRPRAAMSWVRRADAEIEEQPPGRWAPWATTQSYLGIIEAANGQADAALSRIDRAAAAAGPKDEASPVERYSLVNARARVLDLAGRSLESLPLHLRALELASVAMGPQHPSTVDMRANVANAYFGLGHRGPALEFMRTTVRDAIEHEYPRAGHWQCWLASMLRQAGRLQEAVDVLERLAASPEDIQATETSCLTLAALGLAGPGDDASARRLHGTITQRPDRARDPVQRYWWELLGVVLDEPRDPDRAALELKRLSEVGRWLFADVPGNSHWAPSFLARNRWHAGDCAAAEQAARSAMPPDERVLDLPQARCAFVLAQCRAAAGDDAAAARWRAAITRALGRLELDAPVQDPIGPWIRRGAPEHESAPSEGAADHVLGLAD